MLRFRTLSAAVAVLSTPLALTGCEATDPAPETANLGLELEGLVGTQPYSPGTTYTVNGLATTFSSARVYVSNVRLVRDDGTEYRITAEEPVTLPAYAVGDTTEVLYTVNEAVVYAALDEGTFEGTLGEVPAGSYTGVRFDVGLVGQTNHVFATEAPDGHPLAIQDLGNFWGWSAGYIFLRTEGRVDANGDGDVGDADDADWNVHLGTDGYLMPVELEEAFEIEGGAAPMLHVQLDLAGLLAGVNLGDAAQRVCHTMNNMPVANAVKASAPAAFVFHGIRPD